MQPVPALIEALRETGSAFGRLGVDDLARPTCCTGWSVRQVLEHATGTTAKFAEFAAGHTDTPRGGDPPGTDPVRAFVATAGWARRCWADVDPGRTCRLPFGEFTGEQAAGINLFDLLTHYSDIAIAVGTGVGGPEEIWETALAAARSVIGRGPRDLRHYDPERPVAAGAPAADRLRAYLGRTGSTVL